MQQTLVAFAAVLAVAGRLCKCKSLSDYTSGQAALAACYLLLEHFACQDARHLALFNAGLADHLDQGGGTEVDDRTLPDTLTVLVQSL